MGKKTYPFLLLIVLVFTFVAYFPVTYGFFQHDEWATFGHYLSGGENLFSFFKPAFSHYAPLQNLLFYLYLSVFKLNFFWYALFSIFAHLIVVYLCYIFFFKLFKNKLLAFFSSLLFAIGASGHQATSWIAADINTHGSVIFGLLAMITLFNSNFKKIWLSIFFLIISLLFKEITIAFFILLPLMVYLFDKQKFRRNVLDYFKFVLVGFLFLTFRLSMIFFQRTHVEDRLVIETQSLLDIAANIITFPSKIFAQSLIPTDQLLSLARFISKTLPPQLTGLYGTTAFDVFTEQVTLQAINWGIFIVGLFAIIFVVKKAKEGVMKKTAIFGFIFMILNSFIYVLSPGRFGSIPVVDSRNIYLSSIGTALFIVSTVYLLSKEKITKLFLFVLPLLVLNIFWLEKELTILADRGTERKEILYQIKNTYPVLPQKAVFYMTSDKSFYGLPESEKIFPFETNLGYTIMVWYQPTEHFPKEFLDQSGFLYRLTDEGYKEQGDKGFGYFRNWDSFIQAIRSNSLGEDSAIAFSYNSNDKSIKDITYQVRKEIDVAVDKIK